MPSLIKLIRGSVSIQTLNTEIELLSLDAQPYDYAIFGYIDTSQMSPGDVIEVSFYVAVDGVNSVPVFRSRYPYNSLEKAISVQTLFVNRDGKARLTINQIAGTPKTFAYVFVVAPIEQALSEMIRNILFRQVP